MPIRAAIRGLDYYLPEAILNNQELSQELASWSAERIQTKTGIAERRISAPAEFASDLAVQAAEQLFAQGALDRQSVDAIIFCTQTPDYFLPTSACLLQDRLGLSVRCAAFDFNLGCSGYVYGLGLAKGMIETGQAENVLLLTADTYTKLIHPLDRSVRTLFGDGGAATWISAVSSDRDLIGPFVYGTDGAGGKNLIVPTGGMRDPRTERSNLAETDPHGNTRSRDNLFMNGPEIFKFALRTVPPLVDDVLAKAERTRDEVDLFVLHQASAYMLDRLRDEMDMPPEKWPVLMRDCGNTVSASIPIALRQLQQSGKLLTGMRLVLVGFGVGYSWGANLIEWS